jgi:DNA-directed RNA polymerase I, II, and III subunit RPABC1
MDVEKITRSFQTILEMLTDRGIDNGNVSTKHVQDVLQVDNLKPVIEILLPSQTKIIYYTLPKFKWAEVKKYFDDETPFALYILVTNDDITSNNMKTINTLGLNIECYKVKTLQFNITKHELVPKHEVIRDQEEIARLVEKYNVKSKFQFPVILKSDPIAKYYAIKSGEMVKVTRPSPTAGTYIAYRCCV